MAPGALRNDEDAGDDEHQDHARRIEAAERKPAVGARLVQKIADRRAERPRQDKRRPEQSGVRYRGEKIKRGDEAQARGENQRAAAIAEPGRGREEIAERGAERLRKQNCRPVKRLGFGRADRGYRDGAERRIPESEGADQQNEQDRRAPDIADAERAVEEVGHRRADRRRRDDHRPIQERVEFLGSDQRRPAQ